MPIVSCDNEDCAFYDLETGNCTKDYISLDTETERNCADFVSFLSSKEYQETYWITVAIKKNDSNLGRVKMRGKRIEINGVIFYTQDDTRLDENRIYLTDRETGVRAYTIEWIKENWDKFLKAKENYIKTHSFNLMDLPICDYYDNVKREWVLKKESDNG